jgi:hypothetical protein
MFGAVDELAHEGIAAFSHRLWGAHSHNPTMTNKDDAIGNRKTFFNIVGHEQSGKSQRLCEPAQ